MTRTVFDNHGVAHVWAQGEALEGRSNNGNFYFEGAALFSYGSHYPAGFLLAGEGVALLNANPSSMTTTGKHMPAARGAVSHLTTYDLPDMDSALAGLEALALAQGDGRAAPSRSWPGGPTRKGRAEALEDARAVLVPYLRRHALALAGQYPAPSNGQRREAERRAREEADAQGANAESWSDYAARERRHLAAVMAESDTPDALGYLLGALGLGRSRNRLEREARKAEEKAQAEAARQEEARQEREARRYAEATPEEVRHLIRENLETWNPRHRLEETNRAMLRAQKWAKGRRGWKRRHAALRANRALIRHALAEVDARAARVRAWRATREALGTLRALEKAQAYPAAMRAAMEPGAGDDSLTGTLARHLAGHAGAWDARAETAGQAALEAQAVAARAALEALAHAPAMPGPMRARVAEALERVRPVAQAATAAQEARAVAAVEERNRLRALEAEERRQAWLEGNRRIHWHGRTPEGGAYLRAVGVTRDESGRITGGTLETSQGAQVPLAHALRVFRFLRHCRETGQPWQRNGRTIRVGHFQVDRVEPSGDFVAGCHRIQWPQVEALAERLGVADLEPDPSAATPRNVAA